MEYKELEALNGIYKVFENGTILSNAWGNKWREKSHQINTKGYHRVYLALKGGMSKTYRVHRIVAELFLTPPKDPERRFVNHKDGNKDNNHYTNLEWCTHAENMLHAKMNMLLQKDKDVNGKPVRVTFEFPTARTAERFFEMTPDTIARIARGRTKGSRAYPIVDVHYIEVRENERS